MRKFSQNPHRTDNDESSIMKISTIISTDSPTKMGSESTSLFLPLLPYLQQQSVNSILLDEQMQQCHSDILCKSEQRQVSKQIEVESEKGVIQYKKANSKLNTIRHSLHKSFLLLPSNKPVHCPLLLLSTSQIHFHTPFISIIHGFILIIAVLPMVPNSSIQQW